MEEHGYSTFLTLVSGVQMDHKIKNMDVWINL